MHSFTPLARRLSLLLPLLACATGCRLEMPLRDWVPHEFDEYLEEPDALYFKVLTGHSLDSMLLAPVDRSYDILFGYTALLPVAEDMGEGVIEVRCLYQADTGVTAVTHVYMALFLVDQQPETPADLRAIWAKEPHRKLEVESDEDGTTYVAEFELNADELTWFPSPPDEQVDFLVSVLVTTEDGLVAREVTHAKLRRPAAGE